MAQDYLLDISLLLALLQALMRLPETTRKAPADPANSPPDTTVTGKSITLGTQDVRMHRATR